MTEHTFASTNCSLVIGGCDGNGKPIYNDVTRMILECYEDYGFVNPKIQVRIGSGYPQELQQICARMIAKGCNVFSFLNDDVQIEAAVRMGKAREDARMYSAGGCQEPILDNCEFNSRAFVYISLPQLLNAMLDPALCSLLPGRQNLPKMDSIRILNPFIRHTCSSCPTFMRIWCSISMSGNPICRSFAACRCCRAR